MSQEQTEMTQEPEAVDLELKLSLEQAQVVSVLAKHTTGKQSMGIKDDDLYKTVNLEFTKLLEILAMLVEIQAFGEKKASSRNWWNVCLLLQID